jgi:hypothetical protein
MNPYWDLPFAIAHREPGPDVFLSDRSRCTTPWPEAGGWFRLVPVWDPDDRPGNPLTRCGPDNRCHVTAAPRFDGTTP